jgi:hypothetical protein
MLLKRRKRSVCYFGIRGPTPAMTAYAKWKWIILYDFIIAL